MSVVAAAVVPHPPVLVPVVAAGAAGELDELRAACRAAVRRLAAAGAERTVAVGAGAAGPPRSYPPGATGSLAGFGVAAEVALPGPPPAAAPPAESRSGAGPVTLPLSLCVAAWLLADAGWAGPVEGLAIGAGADEPTCRSLGRALREAPDRVALLVAGDGSARRGRAAPGYDDERAGPFDAATARALGAGDPAALAAVDRAGAHELLAAGWPAWQVLAHAAGQRQWDGELLYDAAPYGVGYYVAVWT